MAYYGNLAFQPKRAEQSTQKRQQPERVKVIRRRPIPLGEKLLYLCAIAVVVLVAGLIIYRYSQIYQINMQIQKSNSSYEQVNEQTKELQREVERLSSSEVIMQKATAMGMVPSSQGIDVKSGGSAVAMNEP